MSDAVYTRGIDVMLSKLGLEEVKNKKELMRWFRDQSINGDLEYDPSNTPWCALSVNASERQSGHAGNGKANARSFLTYGECIYDKNTNKGKITDGKEGDIIILARGTSSWQGHVCYIETPKLGGYNCIGGNMSNCVSRAFYSHSAILGIRRSK